MGPNGILRGDVVRRNSVFLESDRDLLVNARINPIQARPEGLMIETQKTLSLEIDAFDLISVRLLLLSIRRTIRDIARSLLFEQIKDETLQDFKERADYILNNIKSLGGVTDFDVRINTRTTSKKDRENNTIRGSIYLIPVGTELLIQEQFEETLDGLLNDNGSN